MKKSWLILLLCPVLSIASDWTVKDLKTKNLNSAVKDTGIYAVSDKQFQDDMTLDQEVDKLELNTDQLHQAKVWNLTEMEEKRYVLLMQNRSALYYKDMKLSPTEILGLNARTSEEREHFAELSAEQNEQQIAQVLAWRTAYQAAYKERTKNLPVIKPFDTSPFSPYDYKAIDLKPGDTIYFYLRLTDSVKAQLAVIYRLLDKTPDSKLKLIFIGNDANLNNITSWAKAHSVPMSLVKQKRIQLSAGTKDDLEKINNAGQTLPVIIHASNNKTSIVAMSRF